MKANKEIKIKGVVAEGFRSFAERVEENLDRPGLNLVKGENGGGKTTLFEVIVWCAYGTNLKDTTNEKIPTWEDTRTPAFRGTYTEITVDVDGAEYKIVRTMNWSGGEGIGRDALVIRGQDKAGVHKKDVQQQIVSLLGIDAQTFMASILFGQRMPKLVESANSDKRDLFERLFETAFINDGKAKAGVKLSELTEGSLKLDGDIHDRVTQIGALEVDIEEQNRILTEFDEKKVQSCVRISNTINEARNNVTMYGRENEILEKEIEKWDEKVFNDFKKEMDELERQYNELEKTLKVPRDAAEQAKERLGTASRADAVADTNVHLEKKRDELWHINKAGAIVELQEELQDLLNKKAEEINAVSDKCYACKQDLPLEAVTAVTNSITDTYTPQLEAIDAKLDAKKLEEAPPSNLSELEKIRKGTIKELEDAGGAATKTKNAYDQAEEDVQELKRKFAEEADKETMMIEEANEISGKKETVAKNYNDIKVTDGQIEILISSLHVAQEEEPPKFSQTVEQLQVELEETKVVRGELDELLSDIKYEMNLHTWWSRKGFVSAGLPSFVFKSMLDNLNVHVSKYAERLGVSIEFSIDLTKASKPFTTICSVGKKFNKEYKEFSGGQKQRLDIVLIFAMHDLVSTDVDINILIMDEVFEGLDEKGEAAVFDLVRMKVAEGKSIYIITHSPHIDSLYSSTITVVADDNGASTIAA